MTSNKNRPSHGRSLPNRMRSQMAKKELLRPQRALEEKYQDESFDAFNMIKKYIVNRYGKSVNCTHEETRFIYVKFEYIDIMIRYHRDSYGFINSIVIARICFKDERCGNGTHFLNFLCEVSDSLGITRIIIESVNRNSRAFAMSLGFTNNKPVRGVSVDISTLKENIKRLKLSEDLTSAS